MGEEEGTEEEGGGVGSGGGFWFIPSVGIPVGVDDGDDDELVVGLAVVGCGTVVVGPADGPNVV